MPIVLTNLRSFIEIPGRRRSWKRGQFDQLTCVLTGPQYLRDQWVPALESPHTNIDPNGYSLMLCTDVQDIEQDGALVTLSVTYQGRMYVPNVNPAPVLSIQATETSSSIQMASQQIINIGKNIVIGYLINGVYVAGSSFTAVNAASVIPVYGNVGKVTRFGYSTITINYMSTSVTAKYQTLFRPSGPSGFNSGCSIGIISTIIGEVAGVEVTYQSDGTIGGAVLPKVIGPDYRSLVAPNPKLVCTSFSAVQVAGTFYDCSETWEYKYIDASHTV